MLEIDAAELVLPCGLRIEESAPLAPLTSWLVGGRADFLALPTNETELRQAVAWANKKSLPLTLLGGGTNVLVSDRGVRGLTIGLRKLTEITAARAADRFHITCLAGTSKSELLKFFLKERLEPALFLAGIPGDVGGGVAMNAGIGEQVTPREFVEIVDWIEVLGLSAQEPNAQSGKMSRGPLETDASALALTRFTAQQLQWAYRHSGGWQPGIIVRVGLSWPLTPSTDILKRVKEANLLRLSKQPLDLPSCGSVFINPELDGVKLKSGQLIETAGLKGFKIGGAQVSNKHANFIVNTGAATATDIHQVIEAVKEVVAKKHGVQLRTEVVYLGEWESGHAVYP